MPTWQDDRPRPHHYRFAHRALPSVLLSPRVDLPALLDQGRVLPGLLATWASVGEELDPQDRLGDDGLQCAAVAVAGRHGLLVTLPEAAHAAEAYFALVLPLTPADARRYFTLEFSWDIAHARPSTVIGEWSDRGHLNWGGGPEPDPASFLTAVERLAGPLAR